ncbi:hypothetical protein KUTeg_017635 [Tegillarca granosa]|uniref:TIR domain-containing protein n=1 Tax=Tegillarca granosa TaxID=220873 RepID=A0ABQ9EJD4_TEGGR|nr:hypothetical protein KUTeg_017635 [Tegillarca granosa]
MFVSHSNVDYEFVKVIVKTLEKDYNIRCMVAGQEFVGGTPIDENIISRMEESMKVLIVLTPNYTESGWCQYEQRMIFIMSLTNQNNCIIPLMLEPCNIPNTLKGLTYIDANCMSGFAPDLIAQIKVYVL